MTSIVASGAMAVTSLVVVLLIFFVLARGVGEDDDYEIEVKLLPPTIRRKVKRNDRRNLGAEAVHYSITDHVASGNSQTRPTRAERLIEARLPTEATRADRGGDKSDEETQQQ
jgi:hypothetical protein